MTPAREDLAVSLLYALPLGAPLALLGLLAFTPVVFVLERTPLGADLSMLVPLLRVVRPHQLLPGALALAPVAGFALALVARRSARVERGGA